MLKDILDIFKRHHLGDEWYGQLIKAAGLIIGGLVTIVKGGGKLLNVISDHRKSRQLNKDLNPYYTPADVDRAIRYYIPTRFQNVSPSIDDEPGRNYIASAQEPLIPLFLKKLFGNSTEANKFYLILADSGMGKTTFMVNLYIAYKNAIKWPWSPHKYDIMLRPLGASDVLDELKKVSDDIKKNTILLLDAFDEDVMALEDYEKRMNEILEIVWKFRTVVISCRTQFFPSEFEEPEKTKYMSFGDSTRRFSFQKLYLSVFSQRDIDLYLSKKYNFIDYKRKRKAKEIVQKCPNLMVRPMLLSHIGALVESDKRFEYTFELYEVLIDEWINRESQKPDAIKRYGNPEHYRKLLYSFSSNLAWELYEKRIEHGGFFIPSSEKFVDPSPQGISLSDFDAIEQMSEREKRGKSLLNRDANGKYKFSHKSIFEYFLARILIDDVEKFKKFDFAGMNMTIVFLREMFFLNTKKDIEIFKIDDRIYSNVTIAFRDTKRLFTTDSNMRILSYSSFVKSEVIRLTTEQDLYPLPNLYYFSLFENLRRIQIELDRSAYSIDEVSFRWMRRILDSGEWNYTRYLSLVYSMGYMRVVAYLYLLLELSQTYEVSKKDGTVLYAIVKSGSEYSELKEVLNKSHHPLVPFANLNVILRDDKEFKDTAFLLSDLDGFDSNESEISRLNEYLKIKIEMSRMAPNTLLYCNLFI